MIVKKLTFQFSKVLFVFSILSSSFLSFGQKMEMHSESSEAVQLMDEAISIMGHDMAVFGEKVTQAAKLDPNMVVANFFEATDPDRKPEEAIVFMKRLQSYDGPKSEGEQILIDISSRVGQKDFNVFTSMEVLAEAYPNDARVNLLVGAAFAYSRNAEKAIPYLNKAIEQGQLAGAYNMLGYAYLDQGKMDEAKAMFDNYSEAAPGHWNTHDSLGDYFMATKDYAKAAEHFQKAADLHPEFPGHAERAKKALELSKG